MTEEKDFIFYGECQNGWHRPKNIKIVPYPKHRSTDKFLWFLYGFNVAVWLMVTTTHFLK